MTMIETIYSRDHDRQKYLAAPLLREREKYLSHLQRQGAPSHELRTTSLYLRHIVRVMKLTCLRKVTYQDIDAAGARWAKYIGPYRRTLHSRGTSVYFVRNARQWFGFLGNLTEPPKPPFHNLLIRFAKVQRDRGLSPVTVEGCLRKTWRFLIWLMNHELSLAAISINDIDDFLVDLRGSGMAINSLAAMCYGLRTFCAFLEQEGICAPGIALGVHSPRVPRHYASYAGPAWGEVRRLLSALPGATPTQLRAKAALLLFSIYGLRSSEVGALLLSDFDWRRETFAVRRAKRAGIQHFPIQFEVGEAILEYLRRGRPKAPSPHVFLTARRPFVPIEPGTMWKIVGPAMREQGIRTRHIGPHSLRHACATHLLREGRTLKEVSEFLGHRDGGSVELYARYDERLLKKVADFSLAGVL
jgi:site-specific recombinase XerD